MSETNGDAGGFSIIAEKTVPDVYSDAVQFEVSVYGVTIEFGQGQKPPPGVKRVPHRPRVRVHMSPQHAKVMAKIFVKNMRAYEEQIGKIPLPKELLDELGVEDEW
ncbi:MAG: DUF3467 domain-containing protein [Chloroflexi bacterium]|nr:DUF3467 domain-containing protein [Chloroflexota bacterium]